MQVILSPVFPSARRGMSPRRGFRLVAPAVEARPENTAPKNARLRMISSSLQGEVFFTKARLRSAKPVNTPSTLTLQHDAAVHHSPLCPQFHPIRWTGYVAGELSFPQPRMNERGQLRLSSDNVAGCGSACVLSTGTPRHTGASDRSPALRVITGRTDLHQPVSGTHVHEQNKPEAGATRDRR